MASRRWKYVLADSRDLSEVGTLTQARGKSWDFVHNKPGSVSFNNPMTDKYAADIWPFQTAIIAYRYNWRQSYIQSSPIWDAVWSGYVLTIDEDISGNKMSVNAVGWLEGLADRKLRRKKIYTAQDDGTIILDLLAEANLTTVPGVTGTIPVVPSSIPLTPTWMSVGNKLPNEGVGGATAYVAAAGRNKTYEIDTFILPEIDQLLAIENGCDIRVDPLTRALNVYRRRRTVRDDVIFGYQRFPRNIKQLGRQIDGSVVTNHMVARGDPTTAPKFQENIVSAGKYGLREEIATLGGVADPNVLQYYASAEVALRSEPRQIFSVTPLPFVESGRVPEPFVDYTIGDQTRMNARHGERVDIADMAMRVFGIKGTEDDNTGVENISQLQLSP